MDEGANEQTYRLMISDYRRPLTSATPEASQEHCWLSGYEEEIGAGVGFQRGNEICASRIYIRLPEMC